MAEEAIISYSDDIVVKVRHNQEVFVELASQGPQGPQGEKGDTGTVTPEMLALRDQSVEAASQAAASEANARTSELAVEGVVTAVAGSVAAASASEQAAKTAEANAKGYRDSAANSALSAVEENEEAQNARADAEAARDLATAARVDAQAARSETLAARTETLEARNAAQTAKADSETALAGANAARDDAADYAEAARLSAEEAAAFDPSSFPTKANNGSDFADPAAVRENIGAQAKLSAPTQAEAEAGTSTVERAWTAERVKQAIQALSAAIQHRHEVGDIDGLQAVLDGMLVNSVLTGAPTAPTPASADRSGKIATTEYVRLALDELVGAAPGTLDTLQELADAIGDDPNFAATVTAQIAEKAAKVHEHEIADVTGLADALLLLAPKASPALTGTPTATTAAAGDNSTRIATTAHVKSALAAAGLATEDHTHVAADITDLQPLLDAKSNVSHQHVAADITDLQSLLDAKAGLASPALTGNPTAPTQAVGNNSTRLATTAFVATAVANGVSGKADNGHVHVVSDITGLQAALDEKAALASPTFTGTPKAPTAAAGTSTTQIATTAFVTGAVNTLQTAINGKADTGHAHTIADITGLQDALDGKAASTHIHTIAQVTNLQTALDGKFSTSGGTVTGDLTVTGAVTSKTPNSYRIANTKFGTFWRNDDGSLYLLVTAANDPLGTWNNLRPFAVNLESGLITTQHGITSQGPVTVNNAMSVAGHLIAGFKSGNSNGSSYTMEVRNGGGTGDASMANIGFHCTGTYGIQMGLRPDGYFGIGGWSRSAWTWYTAPNGDMVSAGNVSAYSDPRLKEDVVEIKNALDIVAQLRGVRFTWNDRTKLIGRPGERDIGVLADEVEAVLPEIVSRSIPDDANDGEQWRVVAYDKLTPVLIQAIKELRAEMAELRTGEVR